MRTGIIFTGLWLATICLSRGQAGAMLTGYSGICDASAAVAVDADHFAVANDEDNVLRIYRRSQHGLPEYALDASPFLELADKHPETDLEGAARMGRRIYWIGSHGCDAEGRKSPNRRRFFATDIVVTNSKPTLVPAGNAYRHLLRDLAREPRLQPFNLDEAAKLAPKKKGALNIEGLSATPAGHLLIGFRNPIPHKKALLVPLLNPDDLLQNRPARFGDPILLDLDGLGIRDIGYHPGQGQYLIIAGSHHGRGSSRVYSWRGVGNAPVWIKDINLAGLNPEGLFIPDDTKPTQCEILSDDGSQSVNGTECKQLKDPALKHFRTVMVTLPVN